jgi:hypothetical protein
MEEGNKCSVLHSRPKKWNTIFISIFRRKHKKFTVVDAELLTVLPDVRSKWLRFVKLDLEACKGLLARQTLSQYKWLCHISFTTEASLVQETSG